MLEIGSTAPWDMQDLYLLPLGSEVEAEGYRWKREIDGFWTTDGAVFRNPEHIRSRNGARLAALGAEPGIETLQQMKQRLATSAIGHGAMHGINLHRIEQALEAVGVTAVRVPHPGLYVHGTDRGLIDWLPNYTLVAFGDLREPTNHALGYVYGDSITPLFRGGSRNVGGESVGRVVEYPSDVAIVLWDEAADDEQEQVAEFRRNLWRLGWDHKNSNGWCGAYENLVHRFFTSQHFADQAPTPESEPESAQATEFDTHLTHIQQMRLPVDSLIGYHNPASDPTGWNFMQRRDAVDMGTRWFIGPNSGHHSAGGARLIWRAGTPVRIPVESTAQMGRMPVGTAIEAGTNATLWIKQEDQMWRLLGGTQHGNIMHASNLAIDTTGVRPVFVHIPATSIDTVSVGEPVALTARSQQDFDRYPIGTVIRSSYTDSTYRKEDERNWIGVSGRRVGSLLQTPSVDGRFSVVWDRVEAGVS